MFSEGRVTRSRARTLESQGQTPLYAVPEGKTPGTRGRGRKAVTEAPTPRAALFDMTNSAGEEAPTSLNELPAVDETQPVDFEQPDAVAEETAIASALEATVEASVEEEEVTEQGGAPQPEAVIEDEEEEEQQQQELPVQDAIPFPAEEDVLASDVEVAASGQEVEEEEPMLSEEESVEASPAPAADTDEPPATPPPAALPSPAAAYNQTIAPTPTGLGLSSFAPLSPIGGPICLSANTPTVTPMHGMPAASGHKSKVYDTLQAAAQAIAHRQESLEEPEQQDEQLPSFPSGFGSPVKYSESPAMSVSIAGAISERSGMEGVEEEGEEEGEEEVCSAGPAAASNGAPSPGLNFMPVEAPVLAAPPSAAEAPASPLDISEELDEQLIAASPETADAAAVVKPKLSSKVVVPSPYDPRSLRQLKKEIKLKLAEREATASAANSDAEEEEEHEAEEEYREEEVERFEVANGVKKYTYAEKGGDELLDAMGALTIASPEMALLGPYELRGMPRPQGQHVRFNDDGSEYVSPRLKTMLRGMPTPHGKHMFFDEDDE
ncbi:hypothetical protein N2152v2_010473 [Parachlorella kessleri]